jgi:signal peptidase I
LSSLNTTKAVTQVVVVIVLVVLAAYVIDTDAAGIQVYNVYPTISMLPTLEVGDLVIVHSVPYSSIQVNDVIVFSRPDSSGVCSSASEVIVHRVVQKTAQGLITQGDDRYTNPNPDEGPPNYTWPPVPASCVRGVVVLAVPYLGRITEAFPPPYNYVLVVAILALVFALEIRPKNSEKETGAGSEGTAPRPGLSAEPNRLSLF